MSELEVLDDPLDDGDQLVHRPVEPVVRVGAGSGLDRRLQEVGHPEARFGRLGQARNRQNFGLELRAFFARVRRHSGAFQRCEIFFGTNTNTPG